MPAKKSGERQGEELRDVLSDLGKDVGQLIRKLTQSGAEFFKKLGEGRKSQKTEPSVGLENLFKQFGAAFKETFGPLGFAPKPETKPKSKRKRKKG